MKVAAVSFNSHLVVIVGDPLWAQGLIAYCNVSSTKMHLKNIYKLLFAVKMTKDQN